MSDSVVLKGYREDPWFEKISGRLVMMASQKRNHIRAKGNLITIFGNYLKGKTCEVFGNFGVALDENNTFKPDLSVVCDPSKVARKWIAGAPDLVIEILSNSTLRRDKIVKKRAYEKAGVREYWLVCTQSRSIDVYVNENGVLEVQTVYSLLDDYNDEELTVIFSPVIFPDLQIDLKDVFDKVD